MTAAPTPHSAGLRSTFRQVVDEGVLRLERTWPGLLATGFVGGVDITFGVLARMLVEHETGNSLLAALAFSIGFVALTLGRSELFTENFLVPIAALVARREGMAQLLRLWGGTAASNLAGGWVLALIVMSGFPELHSTAIDIGRHYVEIGIGWRSFAIAMVGGALITLMTWMIEGTEGAVPQIAAAVLTGFLLAAGHINHSIVASVDMFHALVRGAPFTYLDWLSVFGWAALGNMVGGIGLVTVLRFAQIGGAGVREEQQRQDDDRTRRQHREQPRGRESRREVSMGDSSPGV